MSIDNFLALDAASQDGWTLLVGSAISHVMPAGLPMAPRAARSLASIPTVTLGLEGIRWHRTSLAEEVCSAATVIKFEMLVSRLREHLGDIIIEDLCNLFELKQPSEEHEAIAKLLSVNRVQTVLTTNFDVGIELATRIHPAEISLLPITDINPQRPILVKLHGSADHPKSIVATLDRLGDPRQQEMVSEAFSQTAPKRLLIVGYSGTGDIDVLPSIIALGKTGIPIYWADLEKETLPQVNRTIRIDHNLSSPDTSILMRWTKTVGQPNRWPDEHTMITTSGVHKPRQNEAAHAALAVLLEARRGEAAIALSSWASAHVPDFKINANEAGISYERARAYLSAAHYLAQSEREAERQMLLTRQMSLKADVAFVLRQAGRQNEAKIWYDAARGLLRELKLPLKDLPLADIDSIIREIQLQLKDEKRPLNLHIATRIETELNQLSAKAKSDALIQALVPLSFADLRMAQNRREEAAEFAREGLTKCEAIYHLEGCARAARQLSRVDRREGRNSLLRVIRQIRKSRHAERDLWKNWVALFLALIPTGSYNIQDLVLRNELLLRFICWVAERRVRHIEHTFES